MFLAFAYILLHHNCLSWYQFIGKLLPAPHLVDLEIEATKPLSSRGDERANNRD